MQDHRAIQSRPRAGHLLPAGRRLAFALALVSLPGLSAVAGELEDASAKLAALEDRVRSIAADFREKATPDPAFVLRRVVDAEMLFKLKNYNEAATILFDVVEKYPGAPGYEDALVLLGESLFHERDYNSARRFFQMAVKNRTGSRLEQQALQRLIEIGLHTDDLTRVDEYLKRLEMVPPALLEPSVPYVRGKFAYFRNRDDEALALFSSVPQTSPYFMHSCYFAATVQVRKGDFGSALAGFDAVTRLSARTDSEKEIQELARLAIGRLHHERGEFERARQIYGTIAQKSPRFEEAMNELTWTSIKGNDYQSAYRALDLLLLQNPDIPQAPELRLLMGNLHVRLSNFALANEAFVAARDQFDPVHQQLRDVLIKCQADPQYFDSLIGKGMEKFDISAFMPKVAVRWVKADPEVARVITLGEDVGEIQRSVKDCAQTLSRLEMAVNGQLKVGIFPDLAVTRTRTSEVLNQLVDLRRRFVAKMRGMTSGALGGDEKARLEQIAVERMSAERELEGLPITAAALQEREKRSRSALDALDRQASELSVMVQGMEAELVAIEQYFIRSRADQKIKPEELVGPVAGLREAIAELRASNERARNAIAEAVREERVAAATGDSDRGAIARLIESQRKERAIYQNARSRLSGGAQRDFDLTADVLARADAVQARLAQIDGRIEAVAQLRLGELRKQLQSEKGQLQAASTKLGGIISESQDLGGGLAFAMLSKVTDRFYDLVVQSDVGLVDVAWGLKDQRTTAVSKLVNQQKLELKSVEEDFRVLMEEDK